MTVFIQKGEQPCEQEREAALRAAAARIAVELQIFTVDGSGDYERTFASMRAAGIEALALAANIDFVRDAAVLAEHAIAARLPMACESPAMASQGCLLGYGPSLNAIRRRVAALVARIFRGATPSVWYSKLCADRSTTPCIPVCIRRSSAIR